MLAAFDSFMERKGVSEEWARERVFRLFGAAQDKKPAEEMTVMLGGVRLTVSGPGLVLAIAPELKPARAEAPPEE